MASRKQNLQPNGTLGRARVLRRPCAVTDFVGLDRFKQWARSVSGPGTVFMAKASLLT
ncbi:hypothetical protein BOSE62_71576 [Bosea sp. 62]|nr:hypothetical protein BOSE62_71576 [Bosea sp. 62]